MSSKKRIDIYDKQSKEERDYWTAKLSKLNGRSNLPLDFERPKADARAPEKLSVSLSDELLNKLNRLARNSPFLIYTTFLTALKICLHKYTGHRLIVVGSPARRKDEEPAQRPNALAIVTELDRNQTIQQLLLSVRQSLLEAYSKQDYPFESMIRNLKIEEINNQCPVFDVALALNHFHLRMPDVKNDVTITFDQQGNHISGAIEFKSDLFATATIERFAAHYTHLLHQMLTDSTVEISRLSPMTPAELRQILVEWNDTRTSYQEGRCIHELFEAQVAQTPHKIAVTFDNQVLTYGELDRSANRLANYLISLGVGPEILVGISMERSLEMMVGLLGILKAGGAYVPIDPSYPAERSAYMIDATRPPVLLTQSAIVNRLPIHGARVLCLDSDWQKIASQSDQPPISNVTANNLAYIIFTSGSTGQPKGVQVVHQGLCNLAAAQAQSFAVTAQDRVMQFASLSFDASIFEIVMGLCHGAELYLPAAGKWLVGEALLEEIASRQITNVTLPPTVLMSAGERQLPSLRTLIVAGEACRQELVRRWSAGRRFYNAYGPTEATVWSSVQELAGEDEIGIGRGVANTALYVLDERQQVAPVGVKGELYISGAGLARGYLNGAEQTALRFVPNEYGEGEGERMYRSGDEVRWRAGGELGYVGRKDEQVKVRGYRIELGEVEEALRGVSTIREATVLARDDFDDGKQLIAYIVPVDKAAFAISEIRGRLEQILPEYMIPSTFVVLEKIPLTPNGKIDKRALPQPDQARPELDNRFVAPRTPVEEMIAGVWATVLRFERVGINDNFFEIGGHSLLATQVMTRVRDLLGVDLPLRTLFESPTVATLTRAIEAEVSAQNARSTLPLKRAPRDEPLPLSYSQERLWFFDQFEGDVIAFNVPMSHRLRGRLSAASFAQGFSEIIRRHEILRTVFKAIDGQPAQIITDSPPLVITSIDLRGLTELKRLAIARQLSKEESQRPFDLANGPLVRASLLQLADDEHVLLLTLHHIISDGWSMGILFGELQTLYATFSDGAPSTLTELRVQYADYAVWQRQWLHGEVLEQQLGYWKQQLAESAAIIELPTDRPRPAVASYRGAGEAFVLSASLSRELKAASQREGVTLFMLLLSGFKALLSRYSGQAEVTVGTLIANRNRAEIEPLIGFFLNTLALRTRFSHTTSFQELLGQVRDVSLGAYAHQELPFEKLVVELQPERSLSHNPLFQVLFTLNNGNRDKQSIGDLVLGGFRNEHRDTANFDLTLAMEDGGEVIGGTIQYSTDLFDPSTIRRLISHLQRLLEAACLNPSAAIAALPLLSNLELRQLLGDFNQSAASFPLHSTFAELFQQQVERSADAIAVRLVDDHLTYAQLNARANRLARSLVSRGVAQESLVALLSYRSLDLLTAILAVFKAGGAYLPIDPHWPAERLKQVMAGSRCQLLIVSRELLPLASACLDQVAAPTMQLQLEAALQQAQAEDNLCVASAPNQLAYVIYTSASTGQPKGAMVEQAGMINHLYAKIKDLRLKGSDRLAQNASQSFDISVWQMLAGLLVGGQVEIFDDETAHHPEKLMEEVERRGVSVLEVVPSLLRAMAEAVEGSSKRVGLRQMRWLVITGEALLGSLSQQWQKLYPEVRQVNAYGPTECSDDVTHYEIEGEVGEGAVPIGKAVSNLRVYVLDRRQEAVAIGVKGELYVGGIGVGRGYLGEEEKTAMAFVPDGYGEEEGGRLYRTGDVTKRLGSGEVEFIGRVDQQVKVRGYRIELGEIEAVLTAQASVREAVVVVREDRPGDKRLLAYVVPQAGSHLKPAVLQSELKGKLPEYMVPSTLVVLEEMPLNANGKVDRRRLPVPEEVTKEEKGEPVWPRDEEERAVARIWERILGQEGIGVEENFFELGGHSLLATRVITRVREELGVEIGLRKVFERPTVAGLAEAIREARRGGRVGEVPEIEVVSRAGELELSFAQQRLWFLDQLESGSIMYNIPLARSIQGKLNIDRLRSSLSEIVRRHESLRTRFQMGTAHPVQIIDEPQPITLSIVDLTSVEKAARRSAAQNIAAQESLRPFNLSTGPVIRAGLLKLTDEEHVLLITMHHIVSDAWSLGILIRELVALYEEYSFGGPSTLEELAVQYVDYAMWQQRSFQDNTLNEQLAYWREKLAGVPAVLELPTDRSRPAHLSFQGSSYWFSIEKTTSDHLKMMSQRQGATLFMTLLAAWQALLHRYSGQQDILIGTPVAGRKRLELERLIGFFINTLAMRTDLSVDLRFTELLAQVRKTALDAFENQEMPFDRLVEELQPERSLSHHPLVQMMFQLQNVDNAAMTPRGLKMSGFKQESPGTPFDLTLSMVESDQGLIGLLQYRTDLFDEATITRMVQHYQVMLADLATSTEQRISELSLLSPAEQQNLLFTWNDTAIAYPQQACIHDLFETQAKMTPDAVAVVFQEQRMTYRELNHRAERLAAYLKSLRVGPEALVGLCAERSPEMIVGILGILKAGAAYVPLDPAYPKERLHLMLEDTNSPVVLVQQRFQDELPTTFKGKMICLDSDWPLINSDREDRPMSAATADNLAYVMYTSGSTGTPKGASITHRGVVRLVKQANYARFNEDEVFLHFAPSSFDASTFEIWGALLNGGQVVVMTPGTPSLEEIGETLRQHQVSIIFMTTGLFHQMVTERLGDLGGLRQLITGGDVMSAAHVKKVVQELPGCRLIIAYGPTENTTFTTCWTVADARQIGATVPIGLPVSNTRVYVLDERKQLLPVGVTGELHTAGDGLARCYLNHSDMTAERFIPDPTATGERLYKTGDLVRYMANGNIDFLGRRDHQVKVRGYRIELGEIEAALLEHEGIQEAVALIREDESGHKRVVAYVMPNHQGQPAQAGGDEALKPAQLRDHLEQRLPSYMMPAAFITVDSFSVTRNGKIDRAALPRPEFARSEFDREYVAPRTPVETLLAGLWSSVLKVENVGIHDNFFELGGDSILSIQIISKAHQAGLSFSTRDLFQNQTIATLAAVARVAGEIEEDQTSVAGRLPLTPIQHWLLEHNLPEPHYWNVTLLFELKEKVTASLIDKLTEHLLAHHDALRLRFWKEAGAWQQAVAETLAPSPFSAVDLSSLPAAQQGAAITATATRLQVSLNLSEGPLMRVTLFDCGAQADRLLIIIHHIAVDGISLRLLLEDLHTAYAQLKLGLPVQLPRKTYAFKRWAERLAEYGQSAEAREELPYWLSRGQSGFAALPVDLVGGDNTEASARNLHSALNAGDTQALLQKLPTIYQSQINDLLYTALARTLFRWTGERRFLVNVEGHGREPLFENVDVSRTVGWFTTMFPVELDLQETATAAEALQPIKRQLRDVPNKGIGYGVLRYLSGDPQIEAKMRALPQAEINFNYLGQFDQVVNETALITPAPEDTGSSWSLKGRRAHLIEVTARITGDRLWLRWVYSENLHERSTIATLAQWYMEELRSLILAASR